MIFQIAQVIIIIKDKVKVNFKKEIEEVFHIIILKIKNIGSIKLLQIKLTKINTILRLKV